MIVITELLILGLKLLTISKLSASILLFKTYLTKCLLNCSAVSIQLFIDPSVKGFDYIKYITIETPSYNTTFVHIIVFD